MPTRDRGYRRLAVSLQNCDRCAYYITKRAKPLKGIMRTWWWRNANADKMACRCVLPVGSVCCTVYTFPQVSLIFHASLSLTSMLRPTSSLLNSAILPHSVFISSTHLYLHYFEDYLCFILCSNYRMKSKQNKQHAVMCEFSRYLFTRFVVLITSVYPLS